MALILETRGNPMDKAELVFEKLAVELGLRHVLIGTGIGAGVFGGALLIKKLTNDKLNHAEAAKVSKNLKKYWTSGYGDAGYNRDIGTFLVRLKDKPSEKNIRKAKDYINFMKETNYNNR